MIDPSARTLAAGDLRAVFLPGLGMLGASLRHRGEELSGKDYLALEPMTAPTNAHVTGRDLRLVDPGGMFRAAFRVGVELLL
jgi:galactose mutarotase-like enzyme